MTSPDQAPQTEALNPSDEGYKFLGGIGVDADRLGNILLDGGRPGCEGSLAEYVGVPEHEGVRDKVVQSVEKAIARGEDPTEALIDKMGFLIKRDENDQIVRVDTNSTDQKKN